MKKILAYSLLAAGLFTIASCAKEDSAQPTVPGTPLEAQTFMNVSYGDDPQQVYDLYLPAGRSAAKTKVIVLVHGGGWVQGDKADMDFVVDHLRQRNPDHAVANINYVLADSGVTKAFPNQVLDLGAVLDQLENQRHQLQIKPEFALVGASAGAHLAMLYDYVYDGNDRVKVIGDVVGPTNFTDPYYASDPLFPLVMFLLADATAYPPGTNLPEALSPALQVTAASSPTFLFYGLTDSTVPISNAYALDSALAAQQVPHELTVYPGGHGNWPDTDLNDAMSKISDQIDVYLPVQ
jgi:acetyl esterase/lipase